MQTKFEALTQLITILTFYRYNCQSSGRFEFDCQIRLGHFSVIGKDESDFLLYFLNNFQTISASVISNAE